MRRNNDALECGTELPAWGQGAGFTLMPSTCSGTAIEQPRENDISAAIFAPPRHLAKYYVLQQRSNSRIFPFLRCEFFQNPELRNGRSIHPQHGPAIALPWFVPWRRPKVLVYTLAEKLVLSVISLATRPPFLSSNWPVRAAYRCQVTTSQPSWTPPSFLRGAVPCSPALFGNMWNLGHGGVTIPAATFLEAMASGTSSFNTYKS
jgi:hypothetical protein